MLAGVYRFFMERRLPDTFTAILTKHYEEAVAKAASLLQAARETETGCIETGTQDPRKVRFRGRQVAAYRFIYCVLNREVASGEDVVRHRCHNRRCINPAHLCLGSRADNKHDDWEHWANGVEHNLL